MNKETPQNYNPEITVLLNEQSRALAHQTVRELRTAWEAAQKYLADAKPSPEIPEEYDRTNIINVCIYGDMPALQVLITQGADLHSNNEYPLQKAAKAGQTEMVRFLIDAGANIHKNRDLALEWAAREQYFETVDLLIERGAYVYRITDEEHKNYDDYKIEKKRYQENIAAIEKFQKNIMTLFNAKTWAGHSNEMVMLWDTVPKPLQTKFDFSHLVAQMQHAALRQNKKKPVFIR